MAEKETIVTSGGGGSGMLIGAVAIIALLVVLFLVFGQGLLNNAPQKIDADVKIDTPAKK